MNQPPPQVYETLFTHFCQIYETTLLHAELQYSDQKNRAYLQMGRRIDHLLTNAKKKGHYGKRLVPSLCNSLKQKYGTCPSSRTIRYMQQFAKSYTASTLNPHISWSHYCILLSVDHKAARQNLEKQVISQNLSREKLQQLVSMRRQQQGTSSAVFPLIPRKGQPHLTQVLHSSTGAPSALDLGFGVRHIPTSLDLSKYAHGTILRRTANRHFTPLDCAPGERYCYNASVERIIDGDTVKMQIQLTATIFITERLRLRGVDAMESGTPEGDKAKRALTRLLKTKSTLTIYTYSTDRYGRYVADLIADGNYINKILVEKGHARYLAMNTV